MPFVAATIAAVVTGAEAFVPVVVFSEAKVIVVSGRIVVVRGKRLDYRIIVAMAMAASSENGVEYIISKYEFPERHGFVDLELRV